MHQSSERSGVATGKPEGIAAAFIVTIHAIAMYQRRGLFVCAVVIHAHAYFHPRLGVGHGRLDANAEGFATLARSAAEVTGRSDHVE